MINFEQIILAHPEIEFIEFEPPMDLTDYTQVEDNIEQVLANTDKIEYYIEKLGPELATDTVLKVALATSVQFVGENLINLWEELKVDSENREDQLAILNNIADQLYLGDSDEARDIRRICETQYFNRMYVVNKNTKSFYFYEETDKTMDDYKNIYCLIADTFNKILVELSEPSEGATS